MRRMILPIIKKYWKLLVSIAVVSALGCGLTVGLSSAYTSLEYTLNSYVEDGRYPSAYVTTEVANRSIAEAVRALPGVDAVNTRLVGETVLTDPSGRYLSVRVFSYSDEDLQKFHVWSHADTGERDSVMLEYNFAADNGIEAGDELEFRVGSERRTYAVSAIVSAPETLNVQITDDSWGVNPDFGFAYAPVSLLEKEDRKAIDDAKSQLDDQSGQLDDAENEANSAFSEIVRQLDEAKTLLDEKEAEFEDAEAQAEEQRAELISTREELLSLRETLRNTLIDLYTARPQLEDGIAQLRDGIALLTEAKDALEQIDSALAELYSLREQLTDPQTAATVDMLRALNPGTNIDAFFFTMRNLREFISMLRYYGIEINEDYSVSRTISIIEDFIDGIDDDYEYLGSDAVLDLIARSENGEDVTQDPEFIPLLTVILRYDESYLDGASLSAAYHRAYDRCEALHNTIEERRIREALEYMSAMYGNMSLSTLYANIELARQLVAELRANGASITTVGDLITVYDSSFAEIDSNIETLTAQREEIIRQLNDYGVQENGIDVKLSELQAQLSELDSQLSQVAAGILEIETRLPEIEDGLSQIDAGLEEIDRLLSDARGQLDAAREEYENGRREYEESLSNSVTEFARLREELEKAYKALGEQEGYDALCNQLLIYIAPEADQQRVLESVLNALEGTAVKKSYTYADSPVYRKIKINLDSIETLATFMPIVFFIVVLIVVFLFMSLVIKQCRREIGILRALGFTKGSVRLLFCGVDLAVSLAAAVLGIGIGVVLMYSLNLYFIDFFPLPEFHSVIDVPMLLFAVLLTVAVGQAATLIGTSVIGSIQPSEAMTRPAPVTAKIPRVLNALTKKAKPMLKFSVSSLLRNKGRLLFSVICTAASIMMIFASLAFSTSKSYALHQLYDLRIRYDCQIFYSEQPGEEELEKLRELPFVRNVEPLLYYEADISANGKTKKTVLNGIEPDTELVGVYGPKEERLKIQDEGVILENHFAEYLGVKKGDTVYIDGLPFRVTDVSEQNLSRFQYVSTASAEKLGMGSLGSVILNIDEKDEQELLSFLMDREGYLFSVFTRLAFMGNEKVFNTYDIASGVIVGFAIIIGLTIVFNTAQTNLLEKKKELCILRTLGFPHTEISASWFMQSFVQFLLSCAVGLPLGIHIAKIALFKLSDDYREFVFANSFKEYSLTILLVFAYIVLSHVIAMNALKRWDIVETVKEKE